MNKVIKLVIGIVDLTKFRQEASTCRLGVSGGRN